jgi:LEA14-like dessication related protein
MGGSGVRFRLTGGILGATLLTGCAGLPNPFRDPDLHLQRAIVRGVGVTGGTMDLVLGIYNPNQFDLRGTRLQVGIDVQDSHLGDIEYDDQFSVPHGDSTSITLPISFTWSGLAGAARAALDHGDLPYTLKGQLTVDTPFGDRKISFTHEGRAPLTRIGGMLPIPTGQ